jgi:hypothetical protein
VEVWTTSGTEHRSCTHRSGKNLQSEPAPRALPFLRGYASILRSHSSATYIGLPRPGMGELGAHSSTRHRHTAAD